MEQYTIGIDIGGSFVKAGLVNDGALIYKTKTATKKGNKLITETVFRLIDEILKNNSLKLENVSGIGIGIAGMVLAKKGLILSAVNLEVENLNLANEIKARYKNVSVRVGNDVSCFALNEARKTKCENLVFIAIGTGFNIGVINNGKLFSGANGASLEYGHTAIASLDMPCLCGLSNCVENFVSGKAIMKAAENECIPAKRPEDVFAAYKTDTKAKKIVDSFLSYFKTVIINIANSYRPQTITIGGGLAPLVGPFLEQSIEQVKQSNYGYKNAPPFDIVLSSDASDGGLLGAALLFY